MKRIGIKIFSILLVVYILSTVVSFAATSECGLSGLPKCGAIKLDFFNGDNAPSTRMLNLNFKVTNQWNHAIDLDDIYIRYYFTTEGNSPLKLKFRHTSTGNGNVTGTFEDVKNAPENVCLVVGFKDQGKHRLPPGQSITVTALITKSDGAVFDQTNDYSFNPNATDYTPWKKVLGYYRDKCHWGYDIIRTAASLDEVEPGRFYTMNCYGDFGLAEFLKIGGRSDAEIIEVIDNIVFGTGTKQSSKGPISGNTGCTAFAAKNNLGQSVYGRNLDWYDGITLLTFYQPPTGYSFVAGVQSAAAYFTPENYLISSLSNKITLARAPYSMLDGMNEKGVCISQLTVDHAQPPPYDPNKVTIYQCTVLLLVLNYAKNLDEAIDLIKQYNIYFFANNCNHFLISDADGNSAIVEFSGGNMVVTRPTKPWQVVTNYVVCEDQPVPEYDLRLKVIIPMLQNKNGILADEKTEGMEMLKAVSWWSLDNGGWGTLYSELFNQITGDVYIANQRNYENVRKYHLKMSH